jgi:hypothetical protein
VGGPYNAFQLLAYEVSTAGWTGPHTILPAWNSGRYRPPSGTFVPVPDLGQRDDEDLFEFSDAVNRIARFASVVEHTYTAGGGAKRWGVPGTLKVFVAPEFYFRPEQGVGGRAAYSGHLAARIFSELGRIFRHQVFEDWILVCGTVVHWTASAHGDVFRNTAVLVRGGPQGGFHLLEKQDASAIDGVPLANTPGNMPAFQPRHIGFGELQRHLITVGGVELGVEICLEHHSGVLRSVLRSKWRFEHTVHPGVNLHILTAGGMSVVPASIAARTGGHLLRVDGVTGPPSQIEYVRKWEALHENDQNSPVYPNAEAYRANVPSEPAQRVLLTDDLKLPDPPGPWQISVKQQQISVYPIRKITSEHR